MILSLHRRQTPAAGRHQREDGNAFIVAVIFIAIFSIIVGGVYVLSDETNRRTSRGKRLRRFGGRGRCRLRRDVRPLQPVGQRQHGVNSIDRRCADGGLHRQQFVPGHRGRDHVSRHGRAFELPRDEPFLRPAPSRRHGGHRLPQCLDVHDQPVHVPGQGEQILQHHPQHLPADRLLQRADLPGDRDGHADSDRHPPAGRRERPRAAAGE